MSAAGLFQYVTVKRFGKPRRRPGIHPKIHGWLYKFEFHQQKLIIRTAAAYASSGRHRIAQHQSHANTFTDIDARLTFLFDKARKLGCKLR